MEPDNLRRSWTVIRKEAGLAAIRFNDLRHTCVSLLLDLGTPPHVVREIVGLSDIEITMTIFAHVSLDEKRKARGKLGEALRRCGCCHRCCQSPDQLEWVVRTADLPLSGQHV